jgi:hypothetical protein
MVLRIGNGTYISQTFQQRHHFSLHQIVPNINLVDVEITFAARWVLDSRDIFTIGYSDLTGYTQLIRKFVLGVPVYGATGDGSMQASYVFFPDYSGNFQVIFDANTNQQSCRVQKLLLTFLLREGSNF